MESTTTQSHIISPKELLTHWQGHRNLTRRVIDAFPDEALFSHSIGGMRPFSAMTMELLGIASPGLKEIVSGTTSTLNEDADGVTTKTALLALWDAATREINEYWSQIKPEQFQEKITLFGQYEGTVISSIFYFIDNEIHHRAQAYVYLRNLGIEPPAFYER